MLSCTVRKERLTIRLIGMYSQNRNVHSEIYCQENFRHSMFIGQVWGFATVVVLPEGTDGSSELSEGESRSARAAKINGWEHEIVNIYCISKDNVWLFPSSPAGRRQRKFNSSFGHEGRNLSEAEMNF